MNQKKVLDVGIYSMHIKLSTSSAFQSDALVRPSDKQYLRNLIQVEIMETEHF